MRIVIEFEGFSKDDLSIIRHDIEQGIYLSPHIGANVEQLIEPLSDEEFKEDGSYEELLITFINHD